MTHGSSRKRSPKAMRSLFTCTLMHALRGKTISIASRYTALLLEDLLFIQSETFAHLPSCFLCTKLLQHAHLDAPPRVNVSQKILHATTSIPSSQTRIKVHERDLHCEHSAVIRRSDKSVSVEWASLWCKLRALKSTQQAIGQEP